MNIMSAGPASTREASSERPRPAARVQRSTLIVADLERAFALYRDVLGFEVAYVKDSLPTSYSYPTFNIPPGARLRFATLNAGPAQPRVLALTEVTGVPLPEPAGIRPVAVVFEMPDLPAVERRIAALPGVRVLAAAELLTQDGRRGREVAVWDADGHVVVLYEIAP
jgi:catechol 2,3-dioxygenase-like lactoylglutathione lyase family enzyme